MPSFGEILFGKNPSATPVKTDRLTPGQSGVLDTLSGYLNEQVGQSAPVYQGDRAAGDTGLQTQSYDAISQLLQAYPDLMNQITGSSITPMGPTTGPQVDAYDPQAVNEYFQTAVADPARRTFSRETVPALMEQFNAMDATDSGAARRALATANVDFNLGLNSQLAGLQEAERNRLRDLKFQSDTLTQQGQENFANRDMQAQMAEIDKLFGIPGFAQTIFQSGLLGGNQQQSTIQNQLNAELAKFNEANPANNPALQLLPTLLGTDPYNIDTVVKPGSSGLVGSIIGGMGNKLGEMGGAKLGGMFGL